MSNAINRIYITITRSCIVHMYCKSYLQSPATLSFKNAGQKCAFRGRPYESADRKRKNAISHTLYWNWWNMHGSLEQSCTLRMSRCRCRRWHRQEWSDDIRRVILASSERDDLRKAHNFASSSRWALSILRTWVMADANAAWLVASRRGRGEGQGRVDREGLLERSCTCGCLYPGTDQQ